MGPFKLGITGSIGMGKTQTASFFKDEGIPVWDADKTVHSLYKKGEEGYNEIKKLSESYVNKKEVDTKKILEDMSVKQNLLQELEGKIHPIVKRKRLDFIEEHSDYPILSFDIPLLFESGDVDWLDSVLVVKASIKEQERRVLKRGRMTREQFRKFNSKQIDIEEKCRLANFIIDTDLGLDHARGEVRKIIETILCKDAKY